MNEHETFGTASDDYRRAAARRRPAWRPVSLALLRALADAQARERAAVFIDRRHRAELEDARRELGALRAEVSLRAGEGSVRAAGGPEPEPADLRPPAGEFASLDPRDGARLERARQSLVRAVRTLGVNVPGDEGLLDLAARAEIRAAWFRKKAETGEEDARAAQAEFADAKDEARAVMDVVTAFPQAEPGVCLPGPYAPLPAVLAFLRGHVAWLQDRLLAASASSDPPPCPAEAAPDGTA